MRLESLSPHLARIGSFRLLGASAVFLLGLTLIAMGLITDALLERQAREYLRARIENVSALLAADFERSGLKELRDEIGMRVGRRADFGQLRYSLQAPDGEIIFNEAPHALEHIGWLDHAHQGERDLVLTRKLKDGTILAISGDLGVVDSDDLAHAITALGGVVVVLALAYLWLAVRSSASAALAIGGALDRIGRGDLSQRLPPLAGSVVLGEIRERLNQTLAALQKRDADMHTALQVVAHEMRTPLSHIHQRLQVLRDPDACDTERAAALEAMDERLRFVQTSYNAILRLTHLQSDEISNQVLDLAERAENVGEAYSASFEESGRILRLDTRPAPIVGDPSLVDVAIATLLDNALKHTPQGASVELATWAEEGASVMRVRDDGLGMLAELRARATERFFRSSTSTGFGLGLSIVATIAERLGGSLSVDDANPGLAVTMAMPTAPQKR